MGDLDIARIDASSEDEFKCARCGGMFPTEGKDRVTCPSCGNVCTPGSCRVLGGSKEGF